MRAHVFKDQAKSPYKFSIALEMKISILEATNETLDQSDSDSHDDLKRKTISDISEESESDLESESDFEPSKPLESLKIWVKPVKLRKVVVSRRDSITDVVFDTAPATPGSLRKLNVCFFGMSGLPQFHCTLPDNWITRGYNYALPHTLEQVKAIRNKPEIQFND
jgi:hypothetical protein